MKDGDKAKAAKAKTSGKKVSSKDAAKEKGGKAVKAVSKKESSASAKGQAAKKSSNSASSVKTGSSPKINGKAARPDPEAITFTNPAIESAFKRAVKKYPNTFRRLTD